MKARIAWLQPWAAALFLLGSCKQILGLHDRVEASDAATVAVAVEQCGKLEQTSASCAACMDQSCCNEAQACANDPACQETSQCLAACSDSACRARCMTFYSASDTLTALSACRVKNCAAECQSTCGEFVSASADCQSCRERSCCAEGAACGKNPDCLAIDSCRSQCLDDATCISQCSAERPGGSSDFDAWYKCTNTCTSACQAGDDWSCLGNPTPWPTPSVTGMLAISLTLVNFTQGLPFVGAQVTPCAKLDLNCKSPLSSSATTDATGLVSLMVPAGSAGFDGYLEITSPGVSEGSNAIYPTILYLVPNAISDGWKGRFQPLSAAEVAELAAATSTKVDPARGAIALRAADCDLKAASRVSVSCSGTDSATVNYYLDKGTPSTMATSTDATGVAAFTNLPVVASASLVEVTGTSGAAANKSMGSVSVIVRPGTMTVFIFPPQP